MLAFYVILIVLVVLIVSVRLFFRYAPQVGDGRKKPISANDNGQVVYKNGFFSNPIVTKLSPPKPSVMFEFMFSKNNREPKSSIQNQAFSKQAYDSSSNETLITWLGHSSLLLQVDGINILIDPVFSARASMFPFMGPKAFKRDYIINIEDLPFIDILLISHDHYDHLDYKVIKQLGPSVKKIYTHLGVGAHLLKWGIDKEKITEMSWWQEEVLDNGINLTSVPMRHFSGRGLTDRNTTLWGGFAIKGSTDNLLFTADSGYWDKFKEIGERLGPFDLAFVECGQYNEAWHDIHMMPEETAQAGADVRAKNVVPIHWGKFPLSIHSWNEPIERFMVAEKNYEFVTRLPEIGATYTINEIPASEWWKGLN